MSLFINFHHLEFNVANATHSAHWFCCCLGFHRFARKEDKKVVSVAVKNKEEYTDEERKFYVKHGDTVVDVAFQVDNLNEVMSILSSHKVNTIKHTVFSDENGNGVLKMATVRSQETDILHTLIERGTYKFFLPGFVEVSDFPICSLLSPIPFERIDHAVQAYPIDSIETTYEWYHKNMGFTKFWSVDDLNSEEIGTSLSAHMMANDNKQIKYLAAESVKNRTGKSQIQEFIDFNGGSGIQHIALLVEDIVHAVVTMKERSVEFLSIPDSYYDFLQERISTSKLEFQGEIEILKKHKILMDFDDNGYLLQIFTKPLQDRPTMFIELIQRENFNGFGAGNFKTLFRALEMEQQVRGTLSS